MENEKMGKMGAKTPQGIEPRKRTLRAAKEKKCRKNAKNSPSAIFY